MATQHSALIHKINAIGTDVVRRFIGRDDVVRATWLALLTGRPAFFLGPPGVAKTATVKAMAHQISGARFYDALMPMVTSADQLLVESTAIEETPTGNGGKSIRTADTLGRAATSHLVFADEIWKGDGQVLQTCLDLADGDDLIAHQGKPVKTPLLAFLAASNELPDPDGNLAAMWSRMTIRVQVLPLDRGGKEELVKMVLSGGSSSQPAEKLTLDEVNELRKARAEVQVGAEVRKLILDLYEELRSDQSGAFAWLWSDDRRLVRVVEVLQAAALLAGRSEVAKQDLAVLEWLLWDTPEQIPAVKAKLAPFVRTPATEAQELVDALLSPGGVVNEVAGGNRGKGVQALTQCESAETELTRLVGSASDEAMRQTIEALAAQVVQVKEDIIAVVTGTKKTS